MSAINPITTTSYVPPVSDATTANASNSSASSAAHLEPQDVVELSLAGRIAIGVGAGRLTTDQAQELTSELKTINQTIQSGGNAGNLESQLSQEIYGDGHNGASIPVGLKPTTAVARDFVQAGRIETQVNADNITKGQASQLFAQMQQIYQASQNGASASVTNLAQNQLSIEIYDTAHNIPTPAPNQ